MDSCIGTSQEGETPLHFAIKQDDMEKVSNLFKFGQLGKKLINVPNKDGRSPLHYAISTWNSGTFANLDIIKFLIDNGANVLHKDKNGISCCALAGFERIFFFFRSTSISEFL